MKLPWDKKYLQISFHVIFTCIIIYLIALIINFCAYIFSHGENIFASVSNFFSGVFNIFSIFFYAVIIFCFLEPLVAYLQKFYDIKICKKKICEEKKRTMGTVLTYLVIFFVITIFVLLAVKKIGAHSQSDFIKNFSSMISNSIEDLNKSYFTVENKLKSWGILEYFSNAVDAFINSILNFLKDISNNAIKITASISSKILDILLSLVLAFYLLRDKYFFQKALFGTLKIFLPKKYFLGLENVLKNIYEIFSGYISGQCLDALIVALLLSFWLSSIKIKFALFIGIFSGCANFIPYFGAMAGFVLSILSALLEGESLKALYAAIGVLVIQQIDGLFIVPKIVGERVELSPFLVILTLSVSAKIFGIWGMLFAVPVCAIIKIFVLRFINKQKSKFNFLN